NASPSLDFTVIKLSGLSGTEQWRRIIDGSNPNSGDRCSSLALDQGGDIIAAGQAENAPPTRADFTVAKISSVDGSLVWRTDIDGTASLDNDFASGVAVSSTGDPIAVGFTTNDRIAPGYGPLPDFTIVKLAGSNGNELWRRTMSGSDAGSANTGTAWARAV